MMGDLSADYLLKVRLLRYTSSVTLYESCARNDDSGEKRHTGGMHSG